MRRQVPFDKRIVDETIEQLGVAPVKCSIREQKRLVDQLEKKLGVQFIRMEFGIPGLKTDKTAVNAEMEALSGGEISSQYPPFDGNPALKKATAEFVKKFLGINVTPECCVPTVGAMQGGFLAQAVVGRIDTQKPVILFLDPGFPVNKIQNRFLGLKSDAIDFYNKRGSVLVDAVESPFQKGDVGGILYSNPNNPTWITLSEDELKGLGEVMTRYDGIAIEDLAYFGMDFREGYEKPDVPPYPPTIARYTDNYILLISSSKIFSYAGQRIGLAVLSPKLFRWESESLESFFGTKNAAYAFIHGGVYCTTSGVPQGPQRGLTALLEKANRGDWNYFDVLKTYQDNARLMKKVFLENGFQIVYKEVDGTLRDGFYFTYTYPGLGSDALAREQLYYGFSGLSLDKTGAVDAQGFRACVSQVSKDDVNTLNHRLRRFHEDHG